MAESGGNAVKTYWERWFSSFSKQICWVAGTALVGMMLLGVSEVIGRKLFNHPIRGSYEIIWLLSGIMIAFPVAYAQTKHAHIIIEMIPFSKKTQAVLDSIGLFMSLVVFAVLTWQVGLLGTDYLSLRQTTDTLYIPLGPFIMGAAFACGVMCLVLIIDLYKSVAGLIRAEK